MNTKLTLRLDDVLIRQTKDYARLQGKSISQIVSDYFTAIGGAPLQKRIKKRRLGPISTQLCGSLKGVSYSELDYKKHLEKKYL